VTRESRSTSHEQVGTYTQAYASPVYLVVFLIGAILTFQPARIARLAGQGSTASIGAVRTVGVAMVLLMIGAAALIA